MYKNEQKHWTLYVLKLERGKWYIGITSQSPEKRFQEHLYSRKSHWTAKYRPIEIADSKFLGDLTFEEAQRYENRVTREYMRQKGVNNVRGGDLTNTSNMVIRFGYIWDEFGWEAMTTVIFLMLVIVYLLIDKLFL